VSQETHGSPYPRQGGPYGYPQEEQYPQGPYGPAQHPVAQSYGHDQPYHRDQYGQPPSHGQGQAHSQGYGQEYGQAPGHGQGHGYQQSQGYHQSQGYDHGAAHPTGSEYPSGRTYAPATYGRPPQGGRGFGVDANQPGRRSLGGPDIQDGNGWTDRRRGRRRIPWIYIVPAILGLVALIVGLLIVPGSEGHNSAAPKTTASPTGSPSPSAPAVTPLPFASTAVTLPADVKFVGWALLDRRTGDIVGNENFDKVNTTASMIKAWIAADYLRTNAEKGITPSSSRMHEVSIMIRDSDNNAATDLYAVNNCWPTPTPCAYNPRTIQRLIDMCGLTDSKAGSRWSLTQLSARDAARMGLCIANGTAAGAKWTDWLLNEMRNVRGEGDYGIRKAFPADVAATIAIKNGWFPRPGSAGHWPEDGNWHMNNLAIGDTWVLAIEIRYPNNLSFEHGQDLMKEIASQLLTKVN